MIERGGGCRPWSAGGRGLPRGGRLNAVFGLSFRAKRGKAYRDEAKGE
jgi:hypothetical protein